MRYLLDPLESHGEELGLTDVSIDLYGVSWLVE